MTEIQEADFAEKTKTGLVLVDFYTQSCGPCRMLAPTLEKLTGIEVYKVDCHKAMPLVEQYKVSGVPCLVFMKDGVEVDRLVGIQSQKVLQEKVDSLK